MFSRFRRSFSDPSFYRQVITEPLSKAVTYFFFMYGIFAFVASVIFTILILPEMTRTITDSLNAIQTHFPEGVTVRAGPDGLSTIPSDSVVTIPNPVSVFPQQSLVILDSNANSSDIKTKSTIFLLNKSGLNLIRSPQSKDYGSITWRDSGLNAEFDRTKLISATQDFQFNLNRWRPFFPVLVFLIIIIGLGIIRLLYALAYSLLATLIVVLTGRPYGIVPVFKIALHTIIITELLGLVLLLIYGMPFPGLFLMAFLGTTVIAALSLEPVARPQDRSETDQV